MSTQETNTNLNEQLDDQRTDTSQQISLTIALLNNSLVGHEKTVLAISAPSSQQYNISQTVNLLETPLNQSTLEPDEAIEINNVELEISQDMRDLLSNFPEGWAESDTTVRYHTKEKSWGEDGEMEKLTGNRLNKIPTNADCVIIYTITPR